MNRLGRTIFLRAFKLFDLMMMGSSFAAACMAVYYKSGVSFFERFLTGYISVHSAVFFIGLFFFWHISFSFFGLYISRRFSYRGGEIIDVLKATSTGTLTILLLLYLFGMRQVEPLFLLVFWLCSISLCILGRLILRYALKHIRLRGRNLRHMLIVSSNKRAVRFAQNIEKRPWLGYLLVGFMDNEWAGTKEFNQGSYKIVADLEKFPQFIKVNKVDEVIISLPLKEFSKTLYNIIALCEEQGIIVRFLDDVSSLKAGKRLVDYFEGDMVTMIYSGPLEGLQVLLKRIVDFSFALILTIFLLPVFFGVMIAIKLTSKGPVFFVQKRIGLSSRTFDLYKFRTMVPDAEKKQHELEHLNEVSGPVFKIIDDPRITTLGKFLRKTSIDELPQLINVLKGNMSLVGPRPLTIRDYENLDSDWYRRRFGVRPGITCFWQVYGRSAIPFDSWMRLDLEYIDNWSLWLDLKILLKTIPAVFRGSGAA